MTRYTSNDNGVMGKVFSSAYEYEEQSSQNAIVWIGMLAVVAVLAIAFVVVI